MITKIISFPIGYFERKKQPPLSSLMIVALLSACAKQDEGIPFGPCDIKGSFFALISRGLVVNKEITTHAFKKSSWHVTNEAIEMLKARGIKVAS